jgi:hypothetical protein
LAESKYEEERKKKEMEDTKQLRHETANPPACLKS